MGWHPTVTDAIEWGSDQLTNTAWLDTHPADGAIIEQFQGLFDHPGVRVENRLRPGKRGSRAGTPQLNPRTFTAEGIVWGNGVDVLEANIAALQDILLPGMTQLLKFTHQSQGAQQITARIEDQGLAWGDPFERGVLVARGFIVGFVAHDPLRYSQTLQTAQTSDVSSDSGFSFPITFPLSFGAAATTGTVEVPAGGNWERNATLKAYGPVTNPIIEMTDGSWQLVFDGITVPEGDYLEIDLDEETVWLNGDPDQNRYGYQDFTQSRFGLLPKTACTLRYRGSVISDPAYLQVQWRDAYV